MNNPQQNNQEDNESMMSDDSNQTTMDDLASKNDILANLITTEDKHSGVQYKLLTKNNMLEVDLENIIITSTRFDNQIKYKSESLEDLYGTQLELKKKVKQQLQDKFILVKSSLEKFNINFHQAFDSYSADLLRRNNQLFNNKRLKEERQIQELAKKLNNYQNRGNVLGSSFINVKALEKSNIDDVYNILFESSLTRWDIQIEEKLRKMICEEKELHRKISDLKKKLK